MDVHSRLIDLAKIQKSPAPVVTVYLNTRWADEQQRERVRVFLNTQLARARRGDGPRASDRDLDWIEEQGKALVRQEAVPEADGVALFACEALGLREMLPIRVPFEEAFVVANAPFVSPLAELLADTPRTVVVYVDARRARLIPLGAQGPGEEIVLAATDTAFRGRGGWDRLAHRRYQERINQRRRSHLDAVAQALLDMIHDLGVEAVVLAGETRNVSAFRDRLSPQAAARVVGAVPGASHEPSTTLVGRAADLLARVETERDAAEVDAALIAAAKGEQAVAGVEAVLAAVNRAAVRRLYLLKGLDVPGWRCDGCGTLQGQFAWTCPLCGANMRQLELKEALSSRVIADGGTVETVEGHEALATTGGVAAALRYPQPPAR
jgi:peptide subunit release factor 1 (eRF1)